MAKDLLLEIGTEEIPAGFIQPALEQMKALAEQALSGQNIGHGGISAWGTPRRLALYVSQVEEMQADAVQEALGPAKRVAYDEQGQPTKAAIGFAKGQGVEVERLVLKATPKGEYICAVKHIKGQHTSSILPQILPRLITDITFPKAMRWGSGSFRFARPIHWIVALFGEETVNFILTLGEGKENELKSGNITFGHRFLGRKEGCVIENAKDYKDVLRAEKVIVDQEERKKLINQSIADVIASLNRQDNRDIRLLSDDELLETVTYLVECPVAVLGQFETDFLKLPKAVLITSMREHQKYFPIVYGNGDLSPYFIGMSNISASDISLIRRGYERVLRARLSDAQFFFQEDQKIPLAERVDKLKGMIFQEKLGTYYDKAKRLEALAKFIAEFAEHKYPNRKQLINNVGRAALLCKADLLTEMVGEFPKLQGIMGREYAELSSENNIVVEAIYEHYLPRHAKDMLPFTLDGAILSIADKIDNILGCLGVGLIPSGSQDPYGLRRQAAAIAVIMKTAQSHPPYYNICISLNQLIDRGLELLRDKLSRSVEEIKTEALTLLRQRLAYVYTNEGYPSDMVEAVLSADFDRPDKIPIRLKALQELTQQADFENLAVAFRRAAKIIPPGQELNHVVPGYLQEPAEIALDREYNLLKKDVGDMINEQKYGEALQKLAGLRPYVDNFFDQVLVMAEDERLRHNRLSMLAHIVKLFSQIVDFSKLDVGKITSN